MIENEKELPSFYVVQFIDLPFEGIDKYISVPSTWVEIISSPDQKAVVAYPKDEDPSNTRNRVKGKERRNEEWEFYKAFIKYESNTYTGAEYWIATSNDNAPLEEQDSKIKDTHSKTLSKTLCSAKRKHFSETTKEKTDLKVKLFENPQNPLPIVLLRRLNDQEIEKLSRKQFKSDEADESTAAEHSIILRDDSLMEFDQAKETTTVSNVEENWEQSDQASCIENKQARSSLLEDIDEPTQTINSDEESHSHKYKQHNDTNDDDPNQISINSMDAPVTSPKPLTTTEQGPQSSQHFSLDIVNSPVALLPLITDVRTITTVANVQRTRSNDDAASNNEPSTSHNTPSSLKMSDQQYDPVNGAPFAVSIHKPIKKKTRIKNFTKNVKIALKKPSKLMKLTEPLPKRSVIKQPLLVTQNQSQDVPRKPRIPDKNSINESAPYKGITINSQENQHIQRMNAGRSRDLTDVDHKVIVQSVVNIGSPSQNLSRLPHPHTTSIVHRLDIQQNWPVQEECVQQSNRVTNQPSECLPRSYQNQYLPINQLNFQQEQSRRFNESNGFNHCADSRMFKMPVPSIGSNPTNISNPLHQPCELPQRSLMQPNQLNSSAATTFRNITETTSHTMQYLSGIQLTSANVSQIQSNQRSTNWVDQSTTSMQSVNVASPSQNLSRFPHQHSSTVHRSHRQQSWPLQEKYRQQSNPTMNQYNECLQRSNQNQYLSINPDNFQQEQQRRLNKINDVNQSADSRIIRKAVPSIGRNPTNISNHLQQSCELPQRSRVLPNQINTGAPTIFPNTTATTTHRSHDMNCSEMPTLSHYLSPGTQLISAHENVPQNQCIQKQLVAKSTGLSSMKRRVHFEDEVVRSSAAKYVSKEVNSALRTDECMEEEPVSPYHGLTSDSDTITNPETVSDHEMSTETPEYTESFDADRQTPVETTLTNPRIALQQQMLDQSAAVFTEMGCILYNVGNMYNNLRTMMHEAADTYQKLLDAVDKFNMTGNSTSNQSLSNKVIPEFSKVTDDKLSDVAAGKKSRNDDIIRGSIINKPQKADNNNLGRFVLPPEYDPDDIRWTLKYRENMPGLVELMPHTSIYVNYKELKYTEKISNDCKSLARLLLPVVFRRTALNVCSTITEKEQANNMGSNVRPRLHIDAFMVLLNYVREHGLQRGWNTDVLPIINSIDSKIQEYRYKYDNSLVKVTATGVNIK